MTQSPLLCIPYLLTQEENPLNPAFDNTVIFDNDFSNGVNVNHDTAHSDVETIIESLRLEKVMMERLMRLVNQKNFSSIREEEERKQ